MNAPESPALESCLNGANAAYLEALYQAYLADPEQAGEEWRKVFEALPAIEQEILLAEAGQQPGSEEWIAASYHKQAQVTRLIGGYRIFGHTVADIDPIGVMTRADGSALSLERFDLSEADLDSSFDAGPRLAGGGRVPLRRIIETLRRIYCGATGYEYKYLTSVEQQEWFYDRIETEHGMPPLGPKEKRNVLMKLIAAEGLEQYLHRKYVGQKRFSLEGADTTVPMMSELIQLAGAMGAQEIIIGMAHRGRLNMLTNILGKPPKRLFAEFEGKYFSRRHDVDTGDVKYHQGFSSAILTLGGSVHVAISFNPSHLEIIDPVIEGSTRARQERRRDSRRNEVIPVLLHGDASFAGQGVVMETLNMSATRGFHTGGTIHIIINNQIGFTTNPLDARSTRYCTEVAKMVQAPILHVNGDDPEAAIQAVRLAVAYRMRFNKDVVIDLVCYRRHGHNEADDPTITQPYMYELIGKHPTPREIYARKLLQEGIVREEEIEQMIGDYRMQLDTGQVVAGQIVDPEKRRKMVDWTPYKNREWDEPADTTAGLDRLQELMGKLTSLPGDFEIHPRVKRILDDRVRMVAGELPMDWGCAEILAYATLLEEGHAVRLSGQDVGRGTFSHRHATLHDRNRRTIVPLQSIPEHPSDFLVIDSLLSEEAVLGFEYGYAATDPNTLVIWEAQFGDFANGAQVVIDQFLAAGEAKWKRLSGLTLLLPHGQEGQGPEHSSARLERFLQLCAEHNMQVCVPTTPAQMFHLLRRQIIRPMRRPLIVMSPKSLLRHRLSVSDVEELTRGEFQVVIPETDPLDDKAVQRVVLCSGKVYFDLLEERRARGIENVAIVRLEQLHPFPKHQIRAQFERYAHVGDIVWCQEEPKNQGAWYQIDHHLRYFMLENQELRYVGRNASPSPAVGYYRLYVEQQKALVEAALTLDS